MTFFKKIWRPLVALLFLLILIQKGPIKLEQIQLALSKPQILVCGLAAFFVQFILFAYRWKLFVDQFSSLKIGVAFRLTLIGLFFSFFIPGGVGGDVIKALELSKDHVTTKSMALSTVIADRVLGLFFMVLFSTLFLTIEFFTAPFENINRYLALNWLLLITITVGLFLAPFLLKKINGYFDKKKSRVLSHLNKLIGSFNMTFESFRRPSLMLKNGLLSFTVQLLGIYFMYMVVKQLGVTPPSFLTFFALCCFGILASAIPLTPAGIGVGQAAFYFLFAPFSKELAEAAVTSVSLFQLFQLILALFGGVFFSFKPKSVSQELA